MSVMLDECESQRNASLFVFHKHTSGGGARVQHLAGMDSESCIDFVVASKFLWLSY